MQICKHWSVSESLKHGLPGPYLIQGPRGTISNRFQSEVNTTSVGTTLWEPLANCWIVQWLCHKSEYVTAKHKALLCDFGQITLPNLYFAQVLKSQIKIFKALNTMPGKWCYWTSNYLMLLCYLALALKLCSNCQPSHYT